MKVQLKTQTVSSKTALIRSTETVRASFKVVVLVALIFFVLGLFFTLFMSDNIRNGVSDFKDEKGANGLVTTSIKGFIQHAVSDPRLYIQRLLALTKSDLPALHIDIKFKDFEKLSVKRMEAINKGILEQGKDDFVKATIREGGNATKVKLRLKGDWVDHLKGKKWSFRIHTKGKEHFLGLRRFSIQNPSTRGFQGERLFHETLAAMNIITPRYFFVEVVINGDAIGIMALEEHFSKELLEHNKRKEGVIIRLDEALLWNARSKGLERIYVSYLSSKVDGFQTKKINESKRLTKEYSVAVGLLRGFMDGSLAPSEAFDVEQMGGYLAAVQLWGAEHALFWHNLRFYLNPLTMRLEPIAFDANLQSRKAIGGDVTGTAIVEKMLEDSILKEAFDKALTALRKSVIDGSLIKRLKKVESSILDKIRYEYYFLQEIDYSELVARANSFRRTSYKDYPVWLHANSVKHNDAATLELSNALPVAVDVLDIYWKNKSGLRKPFKSNSILQLPFTLRPTGVGTQPVITEVQYNLLEKMSLYVEVGLEKSKQIHTYKVDKYHALRAKNPMPRPDIGRMMSLNAFIEKNEKDKVIRVLPGAWFVRGNLVIPSEYTLEIMAGAKLTFQSDAAIISYGTTKFLGTKHQPIILEGLSVKSGEVGPWQGVVIFKAENKSIWSFVKVSGTTGIKQGEWVLTGGVTALYSDVEIKNSFFGDNSSEDALNIVNANFSLHDVDFVRTASDAFDGDYVHGNINGGLYRDIGLAGGGDGIDVSGSEVAVSDVVFNNVNDKALSVGEKSNMDASKITIKNCGVAAASKDGSYLSFRDSLIQQAKVAGLMAYVKKPEYGPASLIAKKITILNTTKKAVSQTGNHLSFNGRQIETQDIDIKKMYRTVMKPGLR